METSNALDLAHGVFPKDDLKSIARSLKRSAEQSNRRKAELFRPAMSMLSFFINRAGKNLPRRWRETAKEGLRARYGRPRRNGEVRAVRGRKRTARRRK